MSYESGTVVLKSGNESSSESSTSPVGTMKVYAQSSVILKDSESEGKSETDSVEYKSTTIDPKEVEASFPDWLKYDRVKREILYTLNNAFVKV